MSEMSVDPPNVIILAPLAGWAGTLDEVPDAVFAQRMLGDGIAIDPTGSALYAPCAGEVISVHRSRHAVTLRAFNSAELLLHIGLDTVALDGNGFTAHVADGQHVAVGDRLISFDLDGVATRATSMITPVIITNGEAFTIVRRRVDRLVAVGEPLFELVSCNSTSAPAAIDGGISRQFTVALTHGVHARPAAAIVNRARQFEASVEVRYGTKRADARSAVGLMTLGLSNGSEAELRASGPDAPAAVAALIELLTASHSGRNQINYGSEELPAAPRALTEAAAQRPAANDARSSDAAMTLTGITAATGLAIGVAHRLTSPEHPVTTNPSAGVAAETAALASAVDSVRKRLVSLTATGSGAQRGIMAAHLALLDDPDLVAAADRHITLGCSAATAWQQALAPLIAALHDVADVRIAGRADDLLDLEYQVITALTGRARLTDPDAAGAPAHPESRSALPDHCILLAQDLLPSQLIGLDPMRLGGIALAAGGPTSHVAIMAAAMNIPVVVALGPALLAVAEGAALILDADAARVHVAPAPALLAATQARLTMRVRQHRAASAAAGDDCYMADGTRIEVFANLGSLADTDAANKAGAEGCGLLRTELLFLDRHDAPGVDEQEALYQAIATALSGRPLIIRTLDIGGDKPVPYLAIPPEDNPALGLRGIRVGLWQPDLLRDQLRAILRVQPAGQCRILLPMINDLAELQAVRRIVDQLRVELGLAEPVQVGVMIETPAAAVGADMLASQADFFAIGTNDLTQYTLAMDRGNAQLAAQVDGLHPAVLRLIDQAAHGAAVHARPVGVCGGLASDLTAVPILVGLGVTELSVVPAIIPAVKALVRTLTTPGCIELARRALAQSSAAAVRALQLGGKQP